MSGKGKARKKAPNKAEQQALLAATNAELTEKMLLLERQLIYSEERRWEAAREERLLEAKLKSVQRDLEEKRKLRHLMGVELDRHFKELQQQEAADARVLQQQLQQLQQQQQQQQLLQKQIIMQKDVELLDTEQAIKELKSRSERVYEEFLALVQDVVSQMHQRLCVPETTGRRTIAAFNTHIETIKKDMIANIEAFFAVKKETQTLGGAWRGLGLVPPCAITHLGV